MFDVVPLEFFATIFLTPLATALLLIVDKRFLQDKLAYWPRQIIFGIVFGLVAISQTECAIPYHDALLNVRDAAPVCAGLIFGGPAGILAGLIGGVERWLAVYWGAGVFTQLACSLGTIFAGVVATLFRKYIFEEKIPPLLYAFTIGVVAEVMHLTLVMVTNLYHIEQAYIIVSGLAAPLIIGVSVSVGLSVLLARIIAKDSLISIEKIHGIANSVQARILCVSIICLVVIVFILGAFQSRILETEVESTLHNNLQVTRQDIVDSLHKELLGIASSAATSIGNVNQATNARCTAIANDFGIEELNVVNHEGIIVASNHANYVGFDVGSTPQTAEFMILLGDAKEITQTQRVSAIDPARLIKYVGIAADAGFYEFGFDYSQLVDKSVYLVKDSTRNTIIGKSGGIVIASSDNAILSIPPSLAQYQREIESLIATFPESNVQKVATVSIGDTKMYGMYDTYEGFRAIALYPASEANFTFSVILLVTVFLEIIMLSILLFFIIIAVNKVVIKNIYRVNKGLGSIAAGKLKTVINVREYKEFDDLSNDVNSTVDVLKGYIAQESERMKQELEYAHSIQLNSIPTTFPAFPERHDFDLHAHIELAKEVGGDFYDYCLIDDEHLMLLIADVSGKGIPAALFMMTSKTMLQGLAKNKLSPAEVLERANDLLAQDNEGSTFVTVWIAIIDLRNGHAVFANAGHNKPAVCLANCEYELIEQDINMSLGFMTGMPYQNQELDLRPGDTLFLYTDGITEAINEQGERFNESRLLRGLNNCVGQSSKAVCDAITNDVKQFAGNAEQFDDITMLAFKYLGPSSHDSGDTIHEKSEAITDSESTSSTTKLTVDACVESIPLITNAAKKLLQECEFPETALIQASVAIDEVVANIAHYAYPKDNGLLTAIIAVEELVSEEQDRHRMASKQLTMRFIDQGVPFNPLEHEGPDLSTSPTERAPGGLGIVIVKDIMDNVYYERTDESNVLTLEYYADVTDSKL